MSIQKSKLSIARLRATLFDPYLLRVFCLLLFCKGLFVFSAATGFAQQSQDVDAKANRIKTAQQHVIDLFREHQVVGIGEPHRQVKYHEFFQGLLKNPKLPEAVDDIVLECGNSKYQKVADRYINGEDVPRTELVQCWRNTTQFLVWDAPMYEEIFNTVRTINKDLPKEQRLRLLLADPPIEWSEVKTGNDYDKYADRPASHLRVIEKEVLSRDRKALLVIGGGHLPRLGLDADFKERLTQRSAIGQHLHMKLGETYISVMTAVGTDSIGEKLMEWKAPRLEKLSDTPIGKLSAGFGKGSTVVQRVVDGKKTRVPIEDDDYPQLSKMYDMVLYLGRASENLDAKTGTYNDQQYVKELRRRAKILEEYYEGFKWEQQLDRALQRAKNSEQTDRQTRQKSSNAIEIPFVEHPHQIMVPVKLNGKGNYYFTFDTGSSIGACIDNVAAKELGLPVVGTTMNRGGTGRAVKRNLVRLNTIEIAGLKFNGGRALSHDYSWLSKKGGNPVNGILGFQLFRDWILTIDYPNKVMRLSKNANDGEKGNVVSYSQRQNRPYISVEVGEEKFSALIDTGATSGIVLPGRLREEMEFETEPVVIGRMRSVNGLGGRVWRGKIKGSIKVANMQVDQPVVSFFEGRDRTVIGSEFLKDYSVTFDQKKRKVKFERSEAE